MKSQSFQKKVFKIHSSRIKNSNWDLKLTQKQAFDNKEIVSLSDSQVIRWIDDLNKRNNITNEYNDIKKRIKHILKINHSLSDKEKADSIKEVKSLYKRLDEIQFYPDYLEVIIDNKSDFNTMNHKGFKVNGTSFKRLCGTANSLKKSTVIYVSNKVYKVLHKRMNNNRNETVPIIPAKFEAYSALACSGSIPVCTLEEMKNLKVIVVHDCITHFKEKVLYIDDNYAIDEKIKEPHVNENYGEIEKNCSDGYGLISKKMSDKWISIVDNQQKETAGFCVRNAFCKGMLFTFDFNDFAKNVAHTDVVEDVWGNYQNVTDADIILTESMLKLWNCYESYDEYRDACIENHFVFSVVKFCPDSLENERELNYQFIQTYQMSDIDIDELISPTINYLRDSLGNDYRKTILFAKGKYINEKNIKSISDDCFKGLMIDKSLINDDYVRSKMLHMIKKKITNAKIGRIKVHANFSIISGDPYALCQSMFGLEVTGLLKKKELYNSYWVDDGSKEVLCFRAPMSCHNNIRKMDVVSNDKIAYWYKYMKCCTILNSWDTTTDALNGAK